MESEGITNAIIAGLCFDKIGIRQNLAKIMYKKTLELAEIQLAILKEQIDDEIISPEDVDGDLLNILWDGCALSSAYSQMAFLSLKCEDKDLFADLVERQVNLWIPVYNSLSNTSFDLICGWIQMFINVGEIILGSDHPTIAKLNAVAEPYISSLEQREQSPELQEVQERILSFYTSSRNTPVKEIICQLKEHLDPRSMLELLAASFASKEREKDVIPNS
ncbi:MAG: hypothetical protein FJZ64_02340 [Chlamydiae bacterium]|nr:hypothetical protein [Chlamydiota bacterium]